MAAYNVNALQEALFATLSGDAMLQSFGANVFAHVPQDTAYPYIVIGETSTRDWSTVTTNGIEASLVLHIYSREAGGKQTQSIMARIHTLLHDTNPSVVGVAVVSLRFLSTTITLSGDGATYHGIMRLRTTLQEV